LKKIETQINQLYRIQAAKEAKNREFQEKIRQELKADLKVGFDSYQTTVDKIAQ